MDEGTAARPEGTASERRARPATAVRPAYVALSVAAVVIVALNLRMAVTSVPPVLAELGLSPVAESLLTSLPVVLFGVAAGAAPGVRAWLGEERGMFAALLLVFGGVVARGLWPEAALFWATVLACAGIAVINVLMPSFVRRRFGERVGMVMGLYTMGVIGGATLGAGLTVPVRDAAGGSNGVALGVWAFPLALALLAWAPLVRGGGGGAAPQSGPPVPIWRSPLAWQLTLFMGLQSLLFFGPLSWLPSIYRDEGLSPTAAGALLSVFNGLGIVSSVAAPVLAARMRDQRAAVAATVGVTALGVVGLLVAPRSGALAWAVLLGLGQGAALSLAFLMIALRAGDDRTAARLSGMVQGVGYLLAALGPLGMGLLHAWTGTWTVPLLALLAACALELTVGLGAARARLVGVADRSAAPASP